MQNIKNYSRYFPLHHFILSPLTLVLFIWPIVTLFQRKGIFTQQLFFVLISFVLVLVWIIARMYATKNQDRTIHLEMRLRYFQLTGEDFSEKENQLTLQQILALRFAGDDELLPLMEKPLN